MKPEPILSPVRIVQEGSGTGCGALVDKNGGEIIGPEWGLDIATLERIVHAINRRDAGIDRLAAFGASLIVELPEEQRAPKVLGFIRATTAEPDG